MCSNKRPPTPPPLLPPARAVVLSSGPGCGKSATLLALEALGYRTRREVAADYIALCRAQGHRFPWLLPHFQDGVTYLSGRRENDSAVANQPTTFFDRSLVDCLAYYRHRRQRPAHLLQHLVAEPHLVGRYHPDVFVLAPLAHYRQTRGRPENWGEAVALGQEIANTYRHLGYQTLEVPSMPVFGRALWILDHLRVLPTLAPADAGTSELHPP